MTNEDTTAGAAEPSNTTTQGDAISSKRTGWPGFKEGPVVTALLGRLFKSGDTSLPLDRDQRFRVDLRKLASHAEDARWMLLGGIASALDPEPRQKLYEEVAHDLGALLIEALTEAGQGSAAQRIQKGIKAALAPGKRGRKVEWTAENRRKALIDVLEQISVNPDRQATAFFESVARLNYWKKHAEGMGSKPGYWHIKNGIKDHGRNEGSPMFLDPKDLIPTINRWAKEVRSDSQLRQEIRELVREERQFQAASTNTGTN
ncbi:hypothetical protein [Geminicoccus flavidas]|uniref:hypothetical protein n=1 Tax=Geminicoccus flavidas TaxID=2506407 RepID=UPI0013593070|nr:hypothetical protein [Geminicoccus flavidas]